MIDVITGGETSSYSADEFDRMRYEALPRYQIDRIIVHWPTTELIAEKLPGVPVRAKSSEATTYFGDMAKFIVANI